MFDCLKNINEDDVAKILAERKQEKKEQSKEIAIRKIEESNDYSEDEKKNLINDIRKKETRDFTNVYKNVISNLKHYVPYIIEKWLLFDNWDFDYGLAILCDINPSSVSFNDMGHICQYSPAKIEMLNGIDLPDTLLDDVLEEIFFNTPIKNEDFPICTNYWISSLLKQHSLLLEIWQSGNHKENRYPPKYFIDWALSKRMKPKWLDWAKENGLIDDDNKPEIEDRELTGKSRTSFQNVMAALFNELLESKKKENPKITKTELIFELAHNYSGYTGFSESFLKKNITQGQQNLGYVEEK